jgi:hypothetical protein
MAQGGEQAKSKVSGKQWRKEVISYMLWAGRSRKRSAASDGGKRRSRTFCGQGKIDGGQREPWRKEAITHRL